MIVKYCSTNRKFVLIAVILIILSFRLSTLEVLDLLDTTESRYAAVATQMLHNHNYITPMIPKGTDDVPYLGKPPLHFWFMVDSYKLFGVDEWTSRLPSFVSLVFILFAYYILSANFSDSKLFLRSSAVLCSSLLMFATSGTVMLDVTLTAFTSLGIVSAFLFLNNKGKLYLYSFWVSIALGFLVKGPAIVVFVGLPLLGYCTFSRQFKSIFKLLSLSGPVIFVAITVPWFYLSEKANPGFLRYFFLNENVLRYVTKQYGDLYGQGHVEPYGTAIWMFALGFLPWTTLIISFLIKDDKNLGFYRLASSPIGTLAFCWMTMPLFFLAFIRQLHFGYVIPAIPGAALWFAEMYSHTSKSDKHFSILNKFLLVLIFLCPLVALGFGADYNSLLFLALALIFCFFVFKLKLGSIETLALYASVFYFLIYFEWSPILGALRSTETVMDCIASVSDKKFPEVAVVGDRSFSANWLSEAWEYELEQPFRLSFIPDRKTVSKRTDFVIQPKNEPKMLLSNLEHITEISKWRIYSGNNVPEIDCNSPKLKESGCCRYNWSRANFFYYLKNVFIKVFRQGFVMAKF